MENISQNAPLSNKFILSTTHLKFILPYYFEWKTKTTLSYAANAVSNIYQVNYHPIDCLKARYFDICSQKDPFLT